MILAQNSCLGNIWIEALDREASNHAVNLAQRFGVSTVLAKLLVARSVDESSFDSYLNPKLRDLMPSLKSFKDLDLAAHRIIKAVQNKEKIVIYGDYDVDGAVSAAIMYKFLCSLKADAEIFIPHRIDDGYGLNIKQLHKFKNDAVDLVIAVDCGSNADYEAINLDIVVLDHHKISAFNKQAYAVVNPNREDDMSGCGYLCAAGVVFIAIAFISSLYKRGVNILEYLDLVALATICDVVPLVGLNRAFVRQGLKIANKLQNKGLVALSKVLSINEPLNEYIIGYRIGPHINAAGRIADSTLGARLLCAKELDEAITLAKSLVDINKTRQILEAEALDRLIYAISDKYTILPDVVIEMGDWHQGIAGLLAARLKEKYRRPAIIITKQSYGMAVGSARSVSSIDIGSLIHKACAANLLEKGGGHAMAAGFAMKQDNFIQFVNWMNENIKIGALYEKPVLSVEHIGLSDIINYDLCMQINQAGPYGAGNPRPLFLIKHASIKFVKIVAKDHLIVTLASAAGVKKAIAFRSVGTALGKLLLSVQHCDLVGYINMHHYRNINSAQFQIIDASL